MNKIQFTILILFHVVGVFAQSKIYTKSSTIVTGNIEKVDSQSVFINYLDSNSISQTKTISFDLIDSIYCDLNYYKNKINIFYPSIKCVLKENIIQNSSVRTFDLIKINSKGKYIYQGKNIRLREVLSLLRNDNAASKMFSNAKGLRFVVYTLGIAGGLCLGFAVLQDSKLSAPLIGTSLGLLLTAVVSESAHNSQARKAINLFNRHQMEDASKFMKTEQ